MLSASRNFTQIAKRFGASNARYLGLAPGNVARSRVSLVTDLIDKPGSLRSILGVFDKLGVSLTHIESKPPPK
jgi:prephenate dehydratase